MMTFDAVELCVGRPVLDCKPDHVSLLLFLIFPVLVEFICPDRLIRIVEGQLFIHRQVDLRIVGAPVGLR